MDMLGKRDVCEHALRVTPCSLLAFASLYSEAHTSESALPWHSIVGLLWGSATITPLPYGEKTGCRFLRLPCERDVCEHAST